MPRLQYDVRTMAQRIAVLIDEADRADDILLGIHLSMALAHVRSSEDYFRSSLTATVAARCEGHRPSMPLPGSL